MTFQCRLCGSLENPKKKDTYYYCQECGVIFTDPVLFSEVIENSGLKVDDEFTFHNYENEDYFNLE